MAGGISDIYFTSLRLAKGESVAEASSATSVPSVPGASSQLPRDAWTSSENAGNLLTAGLSLRLSKFERALSRFNWPTLEAGWQDSRLVVRDPGLTGQIRAEAAPVGTAINPLKYLSSARTSIAASGIAPGDYRFALTQGGHKEAFAVSVAANDSWGKVLGKVAEAVNNSGKLSVHADVALQQAPFALDTSLPGTGTTLTLSVNPNRVAQDVAWSDTSGRLLNALGLRASATPTGPAEARPWLISSPQQARPTFLHTTGYDPGAATTLATGLHTFSFATGSAAQPTTYVSAAHGPDAATTIAPGTYDFTLTLGNQTRNLSVAVKAGWTWGDVQNVVAGQINAQPASVWTADKTGVELVDSPFYALPGVTATSATVSVPSATDATANTSQRRLTVQTAAGFEDQTLKLTDGTGGILSALGLTTALRGTVVSMPVRQGDTAGDVLGSVTRAVAMATSRVAATTIKEILPSAVLPGQNLSLLGQAATLTLQNRRLGETLTLNDGATGLLTSLGLRNTLPGQDGELIANGTAHASENNHYALDSGRLRLETKADIGEVLPLSVTKAMDSLEQRLGDVVSSYNDVRKYLFQNSGFFTPQVSEHLGRPVTNNWDGLNNLGFGKTRRDEQLWVQSDALWHGLYTASTAAEQTLALAPAGLIPAWKTAVGGIKQAGVSSFLTPETENLRRIAPRVSEFELERKHRLVNLLG
ncbi:hypothetical protein GTA51_12570 [Desulfovibrio aerotolerans]|uniref:Uncharacterized protein n=1 Tax=Solidesulfovibrio aerotolerans TaxID=295255 RepID=A0A7C9IVJ7_9BACT|nr:hypothetical protein [Solidesulfovibrio aerotolerans]MYL83963.1 hypothetical protein [Solidesulfovibrio aerotolerans]